VEGSLPVQLQRREHVGRRDSRRDADLYDMLGSEQTDQGVEFKGGVDLNVGAAPFRAMFLGQMSEEGAIARRPIDRGTRSVQRDPSEPGDPAGIRVDFFVHQLPP
jgi:hypothetical protein